MALLLIAVAAVAVFAIAAVVVGREARRLDAVPPRPVLDVDEAVAWIADHLPFEVAAVLSTDDVRRILDWNLELLRSKGVSGNGTEPDLDHEVVVSASEAVAYVLERSRQAGGEVYTSPQVHAVLDANMGYLQAIGAIGPEAPPDVAPG